MIEERLGLGSGIPASEVRLALTGAKIVSQTTTRIRPDQGLVPVGAAADYAPFDLRVLTQAAFTVKP